MGMDLNPNVDYGVTMGTPMDVKEHHAYKMPPSTKTGLGLIPIGPNHDLGDE